MNEYVVKLLGNTTYSSRNIGLNFMSSSRMIFVVECRGSNVGWIGPN